MNKSNTGLYALLGVLMCVPVVFIIYFAVLYTSHNIPVSEVVSVTVAAGDGQVYEYDSESEREFFLNVYLDAVADDSLAVPEDASPVTVVCDRGDKRIDYTLYPYTDGCKVLLMDANGYMYTLPSDVSEALLLRSELQYLYKGDLLPVLTVISGDRVSEVLPTEYTWAYKKADGVYYYDDVTGIYDGTADLRIYSDRENSYSFSVEPTSVELQINGSTVSPDSLSTVSYSSDTSLSVTIKASWVSDGKSNYGTAVYSFDVLYDIPARVHLSKNVCSRGEALLLRVDMLTSGESVTLDTDLITSEPEFAVQNGIAYAVLPVSLENPAGTYELVFTSGENSVKLTLDVVDSEYGFATYHYPSDIFNSSASSACFDELKQVIDDTAVPGSAVFFTFDSAFAPSCDTSRPVASFGTSIVINDESAEGVPYSGCIPGNVYAVNEGSSVTSMQRGKVVYVGRTALTGNTVIVSHGMGIYTYYFHLSSVSVSEGTTVQKGAVLGSAGTSPLDSDNGTIVQVALSVGNVFVDAKPFIDGAIFIEE